MNQKIEIKLQILITQREGMIAENQNRIHKGQSIAYTDDHFRRIEYEMVNLQYELKELEDESNVKS